MNHTEFFAALKAGKIAPCYVFEGQEELVKRSALEALRKQLLTGDFAEMNDSRLTDPDANALIAANETLPLLAEKRLVTVLECGMLSGKPGDYDEEASVTQLKEYLPHLPDSSCLVFYVRGSADKRRKLYTALKKYAELVAFDPLNDRELVAWIAKQCKQQGKQITQDACEQLYFTSGRDLDLLSGEIGKLVAFAGENQEITTQSIQEICSETVEYKVFDMATTLLSGNGKKAFAMLKGILLDGGERLYLLALLNRQCRQLLSAARLSQKHVQPSVIANQTGIPSFAVQRTLAQARLYTMPQLEAMTRACLDAEYMVKSGRLADEGTLETLMLTILSYGEGKTKP